MLTSGARVGRAQRARGLDAPAAVGLPDAIQGLEQLAVAAVVGEEAQLDPAADRGQPSHRESQQPDPAAAVVGQEEVLRGAVDVAGLVGRRREHPLADL
jgi:hypothetical protein